MFTDGLARVRFRSYSLLTSFINWPGTVVSPALINQNMFHDCSRRSPACNL